ncbi:hypothetical protein GLW03_14010 [Halobacillus halophilus]|uniref:hypothetical protein n=1 Tax=Halobacillus halophilus TaxID=1570 RepID=UPI00136DACC9|nr:hypothetical protein [Halobacillus halophilus]MYL30928.1 hypothetical protein [Halobacillus halophilus]
MRRVNTVLGVIILVFAALHLFVPGFNVSDDVIFTTIAVLNLLLGIEFLIDKSKWLGYIFAASSVLLFYLILPI